MTDQAAHVDEFTGLIEQNGSAEQVDRWRRFLQDVLPRQSSSTAEQRQQRDEHLRAAFALMNQKTIRAFQYRLVRFGTEIWPSIQHYQHPPKSLTAVERELFKAFACNAQIPTSIGQIHKILFDKPAE